LAAQDNDADLKAKFTPIAAQLADKADIILQELNAQQGHAIDAGGYYLIDPAKVSAVTRCSPTLNNILAEL
jgi:isocitrate dehydrogenase